MVMSSNAVERFEASNSRSRISNFSFLDFLYRFLITGVIFLHFYWAFFF